MVTLSQLNAENAFITDLTGIETATNLTSLNLQYNLISDLAPLVENSGLDHGCRVYLRGNPLSYPSIHAHIPNLQRRGGDVDFDHRTPATLLQISGAIAELDNLIVVEVRGQEGLPFAGVPVKFNVTSGGGMLSALSATTDANGRAQSRLTLGPNAGTNRVSVSATGVKQPVTFSDVPPSVSAVTQWNLPEGAISRLGKGSLFESDIAYSPDGTRLAVTGSVGIWLYDARSGAELGLISGHASDVISVAFSPDGNTLASGSIDGTIRLWDARTGAHKRTLKGHESWVFSVTFSPDGNTLASGSWDRTVRLWDARTGAPARVLHGHADYVNSVAFSPDGNTLASASDDATIRLWDARTSASKRTLENSSEVISVAFSPDGNTLASGNADTTVSLLDFRTGILIRTLQGHTRSISSVAFSPDGNTLASRSWSEIRLWDPRTGALKRTLARHPSAVKSVAFSPDGSTLVSGSDDYIIRLWDAVTGANKQTLKGHTSDVHTLAFSPDGRTLASGGKNHTIRIWTPMTGTNTQTFKGHTYHVESVAYSPDGRMLASASGDRTVRLWDAVTGAHRHTLKGHKGGLTSVAFSPDSRTIVSGGGYHDETIWLWDALTGAPKRTLAQPGGIYCVAFSPDGATLASGGSQTVRLWDPVTGALKQTLEGHSGDVRSVAFSPDGRTLFSGGGYADGTIRIWDALTGATKLTLDADEISVLSLALSPDGKTLATGGWEYNVRIWNVLTGGHRQTLEGHISAVTSLAFSPDGSMLASGSYDGTTLLWGGTSVKLDTTPPILSHLTIDASEVANGDTIRLSVVAGESNLTVMADVSEVDSTQSVIRLTEDDRNPGDYSGSFTINASNRATDGKKTITVTATDKSGNQSDVTLNLSLDNMPPIISGLTTDVSEVANGDTVNLSVVAGESNLTVKADVSAVDSTQTTIRLTQDAGKPKHYSANFIISESNQAKDGEKTIRVTATDKVGNSSDAILNLSLDNTPPIVNRLTIDVSEVANGDTVKLSIAAGESNLTVKADISEVDTTQIEIHLTENAAAPGSYIGYFTISEANEAKNGVKTITVTAIDKLDNESAAKTMLRLQNPSRFELLIPAGMSLIHLPLKTAQIDGRTVELSSVGDLFSSLPDVHLLVWRDPGAGKWRSYRGDRDRGGAADRTLDDDTGLIAIMGNSNRLRLTGYAVRDGASRINLAWGTNLVGLPLDGSVQNVSDLLKPDAVVNAVVLDNNQFKVVKQPDDDGDNPVIGGASYIITATAQETVLVSGDAWNNVTGASVTMVALNGIPIGAQTPVLEVHGAVADDLGMLPSDSVVVTVKNLSTDASLSTVTERDGAAKTYSLTFVEITSGHAAKVGDVLKIEAEPPHPLVGIKPIEHVVTVDDVKRSQIGLPELLVYEIPAKTELLPNYPNPFSLETRIPFRLAKDAPVSLTIFDAAGCVVRRIELGSIPAAVYESRSDAIYWDGHNNIGEQVASGIYFYHLNAWYTAHTRKMVLLKN